LIINVLYANFVIKFIYIRSKLLLMKILYIFLISIFINLGLITAQNCDYHYLPDFKIEQYTEGYVSKYIKSHLATRQVIKIPVVVHIVWKNDEENITDAQIQSQLDVLNKDFRKLNTDFKNVPSVFKDVAADCEIEFCLARKDTAGKSSTGIMRYKTSVDNVGSVFSNNKRAVFYTASGGADNWRPSEYLNIWVCRLSNILGFTTPLAKAQSTPSEDGIVVDYRVFGTTGTAANSVGHKEGRTTTHEIGHYFNLLHVWGGSNACDDDDLVSDTPLQAEPSSGCPSFPTNDICSSNIMFSNFMDYTNDECMGLFTLGQKARMMATLNGFRAGLLRGLGCEIVATQELDNQWVMSPNPASDNIKISFSKGVNHTISQIFLTDILGRVYSTKTVSKHENTEGVLEIPLTGVPNGFYLIVLNMDGKKVSTKIMVQK
jgi:Pregnancy-associated plasma protein-A/Secretion system C-terminal sorting domain